MRFPVDIVQQQLKKWFGLTWKFFTGVIVAVVAFATNFIDLKQPNITVEITSVTTTSSDPIDILRVPDLAQLRELLDSSLSIRFGSKNTGYSGEGGDVGNMCNISKLLLPV